MKAARLYKQLERDFITPKLTDDWAQSMDSVADFLSPSYKKRSMGLVCDFAKDVNIVYTAVFPSNEVLRKILDDKVTDAMLFVHHPRIWDIRDAPKIFSDMDRRLLQQFKDNRISIYNLHVPLDNYGNHSTSVTLAKELGIRPKKPFALYYGSLCGVYGNTDCITVQDLRKRFSDSVGHKVSLYNYGDDKIKDGIVAVIAGGGNDLEMLAEIAKAGVNTFVTGITAKNSHSRLEHEFAKKHKINILGGTHYSTEKFACISMVDYFKKAGLSSKFMEDKPMMEDL